MVASRRPRPSVVVVDLSRAESAIAAGVILYELWATAPPRCESMGL